MAKSNDKKTNLNSKKQKNIYLDYASATPLDEKVANYMMNSFESLYANGSSIHAEGVLVSRAISNARTSVSRVINAHPDEIVFTSGATQSNNLAIMGVVYYSRKFLGKFLPHIITTNIEHSSVLEVCRFLEKEGVAKVTYLKVDKEGRVNPKDIKKAIKRNTVLISVGYANNEIGTIQPLRGVAREVRHYKKYRKSKIKKGEMYPLLHSDITQAVNYLNINQLKLGLDLASFNSSKIYGPKGIGVLYKKRSIQISPVLYGGSQEFGLWPGTENTPLILGLEKSISLTEKIKEKETKRLQALRLYFVEKLKSMFKKLEVGFVLNGGMEETLPNIVNVSIKGIPSDLLVIELSSRGIYVSEKSACKSGDKSGSYVVKAIREKESDLDSWGNVRFSMGRGTKKSDINHTIYSLSKIILKLKKWYN